MTQNVKVWTEFEWIMTGPLIGLLQMWYRIFKFLANRVIINFSKRNMQHGYEM